MDQALLIAGSLLPGTGRSRHRLAQCPCSGSDGRVDQLAVRVRRRMCGLAAGTAEVIRIDAVWLAVQPLDMRAGSHTALGRVVEVLAGEGGVIATL